MSRHAMWSFLACTLCLVGPGCFTALGIEDTCLRSDPTCHPADGGTSDGIDPNTCGFSAELLVDACGPMAEPLVLDEAEYEFDTKTGTLTAAGEPRATQGCVFDGQPNAVEVYVLAVDALSVASGTTLRVVGSRPLVIAAHTTIDVAGVIDAGSRKIAEYPYYVAGAGADPTPCGQNRAQPGDRPPGFPGSGGGGGGFGGAGGSGGALLSPEPPATGGDGGPGAARSFLDGIRGGCPGAAGAGNGSTGGFSGVGGGAVHLMARRTLTVSGMINAGGAGGHGGGESSHGSGGGGGGSGGYIGLQSPSLTYDPGAKLMAGGGGGGGGSAFGSPAASGEDAVVVFAQAAGGSASSIEASDGGAGGWGATPDGVTVTGEYQGGLAGGGGGGGGGVGYVVVYGEGAVPSSAMTSPPATRCLAE